MVEGCNAGMTTPVDNAHYTLQSRGISNDNL